VDLSKHDKSGPRPDKGAQKPDKRIPKKDKGGAKLDKAPPPLDKTGPAVDLAIPPPDLPPPPQDKGNPCGNGTIDAGEKCDGSNLNGHTCKGLKYTGGQLRCTASCLLDSAGCYKVASLTGTPVSSAPVNQDHPAVASDGTYYLVVWSDYSTIASGYSYRIRDRLVDKAGKTVNKTFTIYSNKTVQLRWPSVAYYKGEYLVAWTTLGGSTYKQIWGHRVSQKGVVPGSGPTMITNKGKLPSVAAGGGGFLVAWHNPSGSSTLQDVRAARVGPGLNVQDPKGIDVATWTNATQQYAAATFVGKNFFVAWEDARNKTTGPDIYAARITVNGSLLDKNGIVVSAAADAQRQPAVASDGKTAMVVWEDRRGGAASSALYAAQVTANGVVVNKTGRQISSSNWGNSSPAIAWGNGSYQVLQVVRKLSGVAGDRDVRGERLDSTGKLLTGVFYVNVTTSGARAGAAVARGNNAFLTAWTDYRNPQTNIYMTLVTP